MIKKSAVYLIGRALPAAIGVGGVALYTRLLDPASVGTYALLLSISLLTSAVGFSWLRVAALRIASGSEESTNGVLAATILVSFAGTAAVSGIVEGLVLHFIKPGLPLSSLLLAVAAGIASAWFELNGTMLQARLSVLSWGLLSLSRAGGALLISVGLILAGFKTDALLAGFVLGNCTTLLFAKLWAPGLRASFSPSLFVRCFRFGWPSSVTAAFSQLSPTFQRYMLDFSIGTGAVGVFAVAQDFTSQTIFVLVGSVSLAGIPLAFKAKDRGVPGALHAQLLENAGVMFAVSLPAAVGVAVLGGPIAHVFFGARFRDGAEIIIALIACSSFLAGLRMYYFDQSFELALDTKPQATIACIGTLAVVILSYVLVPRIGASGAATASLGGGALWMALSIVWGRRVQPMPIPFRSWGKTIAATAGMVAAIELIPDRNQFAGLAGAVVLGGLAYAALSLVMRVELIRSRFPHRFAWLQRL